MPEEGAGRNPTESRNQSSNALPSLSQNRSTMSQPTLTSAVAARASPLPAVNYPLYEYTTSSKGMFPSQFYDRNNVNF